MYQYNVCVYAPNAEWTCKTNDPRYAIQTMFEYVEQGFHVDVINGFTGEVLCIQNHPEPYMQEDFGLMVLGWMMEQIWR